jgi:hypothetical protein
MAGPGPESGPVPRIGALNLGPNVATDGGLAAYQSTHD